jgi:type I restriction enzyme S subunit
MSWLQATLGDLSVKIGSGATPTGGSNAYKETGISLIRSQNVLDFQFSNDGLAFIDDDQAEELSNVTVEEKDVLLNITGDSVARCCILPKSVLPARVNQHVAIIRLNPSRANYSFIFYLLQARKEELLMQAEIGATRKALTKGMIERFDVLIPSLPEQKAIAAVLSSLDDKIDLLHRQNKTLESLAETLFRQWFVEEEENAHVGKLGDWVKETFGGDWGKENQEDDFSVPVNCIRGTDIADLQNGLAQKTPLRFVSEKKLGKIEPINGDIIFEISGGTENQSTGRAAYINEDVKSFFSYPIVFSNFCRLLRPVEKEYSYFLFLYLRYLYDRDEFFGLENGSSGIKNLNYKSLLFELEYLMPSKEKVLRFDEKVSLFFAKINKNKRQIITLEKLRDTLLPKLMSGEVRVAV